MKPNAEAKVLREFLKTIDAPDKAQKRFMSYSKIAMVVTAFMIFLLLSNNVDLMENPLVFGACAFAAGVAFGLAMWFLQAGTQTGIMARHISRKSIDQRISQIEGK